VSTAAAERKDDQLWSAIADPSRRRILDILVVRGEATATRVAAELPLTRQAVAKHLTVLQRAGLVAGHREGREIRFAVRPQRLDEATKAMSGQAARWDRRLRTIKRLAEDAAAGGR
jgi:ArsR family transcriptional regulator, cadmium/lead-responsive transcriptional repressor